ncbi:MAG: PAS domain S-box protein [Candidatus Sulfotelmatobacter sp.]
MSSADRGIGAQEVNPIVPVAHKQKKKKQWITGRSVLILGTGAIALHLVQEFIFGPSAAGSFIANTVQIFCAGVAAAACFAASRRGTGFTRPFWLLIGFSFVVWAAANTGWMYYESYLQISPPRESFCHFLMDFRWIVLAMALLLDQNENCPRHYFEPASLLDTLQLFIIFVLIYLGWYHVPSLHESRMLSLLRSDQIELSENFGVLTLAALQLIRARTAELRRLYGSFLLCFVPLTVGICVTDYRELRLFREVPSGSWLDLWWTVPFLFAAWWAARWEQTPSLFDTRRTEQRFVSMLFENTMYAGGPLIVLLQVAQLGPEWRKISFLLLGLSILGFGARLALSKFQATEAALRIRQMNDELVESEDRYRDLVEHSEDLVCTHDLYGNLLSVNPAPARLLGYEVSELLKIPMRDQVVPECRTHFDQYLTRIRTTGADKGLMLVMTRAGEQLTWEYSNTLRTEGVTKPIVRGIAHDVTQKKRAELAMRHSEHRYRTLFEKTVAGVGIVSLDGRIIDCNDAWARMFGHSKADECRGGQVQDRYQDPAEHAILVAELEENGFFLNREWHLRKNDGSSLWVLMNSVLIAEDRSEPLIQSTMFDITSRKQAEQALFHAKEFSENLIQTANVIILGLDVHGHVTLLNREGEQITGYTFPELKGESLSVLVPKDRFPDVWKEFDRLVAGTGGDIYENPILTKTGEARYIAWTSSTLRVNGEVVATISFGKDITEHKRAEEARLAAETALRKSEEHFRLLVEQASDGIFLCDSQGRYQAVNSAGAEMLGYTREELLQLAIPDIVVPEEVCRISPEVARFAGGAIVLSEWKFKRKDGSIFTGEVCGRQLPDGKLQAIVRDITERRRAEEALRQSEERFRVALNESPITVFNQDRELRYTWIYNPQLYWQHEVIGKTDEEVLGKKKAAELTGLKTRVLQSGTALREEVVIPVNGHSHVCDMTAEPLFDKDRNVIGITGACMDIGWLRERADRLQESRDQIAREKAYLETQIQTELGFEDVIGQTPALREVLQKAQIVAPTDSTVLLLGETGTGKELIARSLHALSTRRERTFVKLNCAAVPSGLLESELFGHEKGAFTGAVTQKVGRIELADKGTLFLDEIGEMPLELQPKLLRVLQDREFERLGGVKTLHVDVRIISATNRDLQQDIADKKFREDLFYRLNVFPIEMPPLRERKEDIPMLVRHFVDKHSTRMGKHVDVVSDDIMQTLKGWSWPGNIRELENMIERMVILSKGCVLAPPPADLLENSHAADDHLTEMEREHIIRVLRETNGVLSGSDGAALRLGVKRTTLQSMMKRLRIEVHDYRSKGNGDSPRY